MFGDFSKLDVPLFSATKAPGSIKAQKDNLKNIREYKWLRGY